MVRWPAHCPDDARMSLRRYLRRYRTRAGLSQNELARKAGLDPGYINRMEHHGEPGARDTSPSRHVMLNIVDALDLSIADGDRLLYAAGLAPRCDYQALYEWAMKESR